LSYVGAAQGHTAGDPEAPANDMAEERGGSSVLVSDRLRVSVLAGGTPSLSGRLARQQVRVRVQRVRPARAERPGCGPT